MRMRTVAIPKKLIITGIWLLYVPIISYGTKLTLV